MLSFARKHIRARRVRGKGDRINASPPIALARMLHFSPPIHSHRYRQAEIKQRRNCSIWKNSFTTFRPACLAEGFQARARQPENHPNACQRYSGEHVHAPNHGFTLPTARLTRHAYSHYHGDGEISERSAVSPRKRVHVRTRAVFPYLTATSCPGSRIWQPSEAISTGQPLHEGTALSDLLTALPRASCGDTRGWLAATADMCDGGVVQAAGASQQ